MRRARRRGFTLVELVLALGLLSMLTLALVQLLDTSLGIWRRTESARDLQEVGGAVLDGLVRDFASLEGGPRGDLVTDWKRFDLDRDGQATLPLQRLRLVRQADAADLLRAGAGEALAQDDAETLASRGGALDVDPRAKGLLQVCWALVPSDATAPDERALATLVRGERRLDDEGLDFFDPRFFSANGKPVPGSVERVTGGVLWFEILHASKTSVVEGGWKLGPGLAECSASWDARGAGRPDLDESPLNEPPGGVAPGHAGTELPRRVRITLELERPRDLRLRTRLETALGPEGSELTIGDERRLPTLGAGGEAAVYVRVGEEWMKLLSSGPGYALVVRAQRGTRATTHDAGELVHWGERLVREVPITTARSEWDL